MQNVSLLRTISKLCKRYPVNMRVINPNYSWCAIYMENAMMKINCSECTFETKKRQLRSLY